MLFAWCDMHASNVHHTPILYFHSSIVEFNHAYTTASRSSQVCFFISSIGLIELLEHICTKASYLFLRTSVTRTDRPVFSCITEYAFEETNVSQSSWRINISRTTWARERLLYLNKREAGNMSQVLECLVVGYESDYIWGMDILCTMVCPIS